MNSLFRPLGAHQRAGNLFFLSFTCAALALLLGASAAQAGDPGIVGQGAPLGDNDIDGGHACARPAPGSVIAQPVEIYSSNGVLNTHLDYYADLDDNDSPTFCFLGANGAVSPVLHAKPGDTVNITVTNHVAPLYAGMPADTIVPAATSPSNQCGEPTQFVMDPSSMNVHFHGFLASPVCQGDNVVHTVIAAGDTFQYTLKIPANEPPGLYWYHPHVHGSAEQAVQGGASGALVIDGIEQFHPIAGGLPERVLVLRDQPVPTSTPAPGGVVPTWDVSVNYVPVLYTGSAQQSSYTLPGTIQMQSGQPELWRVANAGADAILDFQVLYDGVPQVLTVVGLDGIPVNSQNAVSGSLETLDIPVPIPQITISMAPAQRAEFIVAPPGPWVKSAVVRTRTINTGPIGDSDPERTLAAITTQRADTGLPRLPASKLAMWPQRFAGVDTVPATTTRKLFFDEVLSNPADPSAPTNFYMAVEGQPEQLYTPGIAPAIVTKVGSVESWTVENHALEAHVFHIHQIHFLLEAENGVPLPPAARQLRDDYFVPAWNPPQFNGVPNGATAPVYNAPYDPKTGTLFANMTPAQQAEFLKRYPYPSFTARFDFRDPIVAGDFVFHCHILAHEDGGMMAVMRVLP